jgi:hypothetical protein
MNGNWDVSQPLGFATLFAALVVVQTVPATLVPGFTKLRDRPHFLALSVAKPHFSGGRWLFSHGKSGVNTNQHTHTATVSHDGGVLDGTSKGCAST